MAREGMVLSTSTLLPLRKREGAARPGVQCAKRLAATYKLGRAMVATVPGRVQLHTMQDDPSLTKPHTRLPHPA